MQGFDVHYRLLDHECESVVAVGAQVYSVEREGEFDDAKDSRLPTIAVLIKLAENVFQD